jgi:hypothetical protein
MVEYGFHKVRNQLFYLMRIQVYYYLACKDLGLNCIFFQWQNTCKASQNKEKSMLEQIQKVNQLKVFLNIQINKFISH